MNRLLLFFVIIPFFSFSQDINYAKEIDPISEPGRTNIDGLFAAGAILGARDIPDTVLHSGAAAAQTANYLEALETK